MPEQSQCPAVTIINLKGGVGKTHTSWLIGSVYQEQGKRVLLIDTDPQGNLTGSFLEERDGQPGIEAAFDPSQDIEPTRLVRRTQWSHIDLIPSHPLLSKFDLSDQRRWEAADLQFALIEVVAKLRATYDLIVFDCPPRLSLASFASLCASDFVVIPLEAADWGAQGITQVSEAVKYVQSRHNARLQLLGYVISRFKARRAYQQSYLESLHTHFGRLAFDTVVPDLAAYEKSVTDRIPLTVHSPRSRAADIARAFVAELEQRIADHRVSALQGRQEGASCRRSDLREKQHSVAA